MVTEQQPTTTRVRRKASRAAGPPKSEQTADKATTESAGVATEGESKPARPTKLSKPAAKARPPRRRQAHRRLVGWISLAAAIVSIAVLAAGVTVLVLQHGRADARQAREQRFVDAGAQTVVNMYSYTPDTIDESVNRFVNGTSGPLRSKFGAENVEFLKSLYRKTNATSEAVINGAALESIDAVSDNASVLVSVRVTVADIDGVNKPSEPYRLRVIVHEDDKGRMTGYDLMYPNGGN